MQPRAEIAHWWFGSILLLLGLIVLAEAIVGREVFRRRPWRAMILPSTILAAGVLLWIVAALSTFSTLHLIAHSVWAQAAMIAGAVQLAVVRGRLHSPAWSLVTAAALSMSGAMFLIHEQNGWFFSRSAFLHHAIGWVCLVGALIPLAEAVRPRRAAWAVGLAVTFVTLAVLLYADRDIAPIFGHLSDLAGNRK
jgi:hypothetical protein